MKGSDVVHNVTRGAFWLAIEKATALLSGFLYVALVLRWLGPTKYGIMALALAFTGLATATNGNLEEFLERYGAEYEVRGLVLTLRRAHLLALGLKLGLSLVASAILLALAPLLATQFNMPELATLIPLLVATVVFDPLCSTGRSTLFGIQQFRWVSALAVLFHLAKTAMVGLLWWTRHGLVSLAIGFSVLSVAQGLVQTAIPLWMMRRAEDREPPSPERGSRALLRSMLSYCLPLLGARVTFLSGQNLSKIILGKLFDPSDLGYFTFAAQTIERFVQLAQALSTSLLPSLTQLVVRGEHGPLRKGFDQALRLVQTAAFTLSFGLFVFARELTLFWASPLFEHAIPILRVMALVPIARTAQQPLTMLFQSLGRTRTVLGLAMVKFVTEFGCYFLFVTTMGMLGAGWANLAGAAVSYVAAMALVARMLPEGARGRTRTTGKAVGLLSALLVACLLGEWRLSGAAEVAFHAALVLPAVWSVFALGMVRRDDIDRLAEIQLSSAWMRGVRDAIIAMVARIARLAEPKGVS